MSVKLTKHIIDLRKKANIEIQKKGLENFKAQVVLVLDISKSMNPLFKSGVIQQVVERILGLALNFDDDGNIDVMLFGTNAYQLPSVSLSDLDNYVQRVILSEYKIVEATRYSVALRRICEKYKENRLDPVFVIFITDGNNSDKRETTNLMRELSKERIFFQFVGIGKEDFPYLRKLDELDGRLLDNAGFMHVDDISSIEDSSLYRELLNEFPEWIESANRIGIL
jgi:uncharacterized protein with von Willebrand factor type A (vWA) domain